MTLVPGADDQGIGSYSGGDRRLFDADVGAAPLCGDPAMPESPHQSALRKGRFDQSFGLYFVTKCVAHKRALTEQQRTDVCHAFLHARAEQWIGLHAFVVMPDHWHLLINLVAKETLADVVGAVARYARFAWRRSEQDGYRWQPGFFDRKIRAGTSVTDVVCYIESNPVRRGWATSADEWPWSSAHGRYQNMLDRHLIGRDRWDR